MTPPPRARALWPAAYSSQAQRTARRGDNKALTSKQCKYPHYQPLTLSNILAAVSNTIYHVSPEALTAFTMLALIAQCSLPYRVWVWCVVCTLMFQKNGLLAAGLNGANCQLF